VHEAEDSIRDLQEELGQELYDRARVWRNCVPGDFDGNTITVTVIPPEDAGSAAPDLLIADNAIIYAFKESDSPEGWKLPSTYLAEFQVAGKTPTSVTLAPTIPLDAEQQAEIRNRTSTWVLYELMPVDSYQAYAGLHDPDAVDPDADFRAKLQQLMPSARMSLVGPAYDRLIDEYARDRRTANPSVDPPKVRFLKVPEPIKVDSDDETAQFALRYYDATGRAVPASLRTGDFDPDTKGFSPGEIEFDIGDVALLDAETADGLIAEGVCEELESVFVRELRDYAYEFHEMYAGITDMNDHAVRITHDTSALVLAGRDAGLHVTYRTGEKDTLLADLKGYEADRDAVSQYLAALTAQWRQLQQGLSLLYRTNNALVADLTRHQYALARQINERTQQTEPTAESPGSPTPPVPRP
jgi:hypothetical protein